MKCGEKGFLTKAGLPCGQDISESRKACLWHSKTPEERSRLGARGGLASRMNKVMDASYVMVPFTSRESVIHFAQELAQRVLTEKVDPRRVDTALRAANVALTAYGAQTQERLVEALLKIEHGGAALLMLARLQEGMREGKRRPLPGVNLNLVVAEEKGDAG